MRFSFIVGLIERPLTLSLIAGFATGLWDVALPLGITLELLWLDVVAMGSIIQPFGGMAFLLLFPVCATLSWTQPGVLLLPLILCMIAAHLGAFCELRYRVYQNRLLDLVIPETDASRDGQADRDRTPSSSSRLFAYLAANAESNELRNATPEHLLFGCIYGRMLWHAFLYLFYYAILCMVVSTLLTLDLYPSLPNLDWTFVFAIATIGAVLSLRERRAYVLCALVLLGFVALISGGEFLSHLQDRLG